jgi:phage terminase large subunit-like protein
LTEEQRKELYQKAGSNDEIKRRQSKERLNYYNIGPVHQKQMEFHKNPARIRVSLGGNRTGKTECGAVEAVWFARGNHPFKPIKRPTIGWVISLTNDVQKDVAQKKVLSYLQPDWIVDIKMRDGKKPDANNLENVTGTIESIQVKFALNGTETGEVSTIGFKTCEQGREKFQGAKLHYVWFDEEPPEDIYKECQMRLVDLDGYLWMTMTPLKGLTWVYTNLYQKSQMFVPESRIWCIFMEWRDNPFLPRDVIKQLEADMPEEERESRQYGRFVSLSGLVYSEFRYDTHVIDPFPIDPGNHYYIMMDNGWNTTAVLFSAVYDDELVIFDEIYAKWFE